MNSLLLKSIKLQNFATFKQQEFTLANDFNCIIGETGSGKSLILDAIHLILGQRADKKLIRKDAEFSTVEAIFESNSDEIKKFFDEQGFPFDSNEITIKRIIYKNESSKSFVNFQSCTSSTLASFAKRFFDVVGQFENQKLLSQNYQLSLLDRFSGLTDDVSKYSALFSQHNALNTKLEKMIQLKNDQESQLDFINFQIEEIEKTNPSVEREQLLAEQKKSFQHFERKAKIVAELDSALHSNEQSSSIISNLSFCFNLVSKNSDLFQNDVIEHLQNALNSVHEFSNSISSNNFLSISENDLDSILSELDQYQKLKRKFGGSIESVIEAKEKFLQERNSFQNLDQDIIAAKAEIKQLETELFSTARRISEIRMTSSKRLSELLSINIQKLNMKGAIARFEITQGSNLTSTGLDELSLYIQTNPGEGFFLLKDIASGGELSRVLLAFRQILSSTDSISVFLFDEIDTGIGGETALHIGEALLEVGQNSQVIAISHLPQIAAFAKKLLVVSKSSQDDRTLSIVSEVTGAKMKQEISLMNPSPLG